MFKEAPMARCLRLAFTGGIAGLAIVGQPAFAQTGTQSETVQTGERVQVTGSSIKRIDAETSLPVQILNRQDIDRLNPQNTEDLLRSISATSSSGGTQLSTGAGATTGGISTASLRALGEQRTLILVNGRRISPYGGAQGTPAVDVNSIPVALIERIEVLKDGASAIYGSDAIAGVINFILRSDFTGALVEAQYGQSSHSGDGKSYYGDTVLGFGDIQKDHFNAILSASFNREDAIYGGQRNFANTTYFPRYGKDGTSGNTYPADIQTLTGGSINFLAPRYAAQVAQGTYPTFGFTNCAPGINRVASAAGVVANTCRYDPGPVVALLPESERSAVGLQGRYALNDAVEFYGEANAQHNVIKTTIQATPISSAFVLQSNDPYTPAQTALLNSYAAVLDAKYGAGYTDSLRGSTAFLLPTTSPYYPTAFAAANGLAGAPLNLFYRSVESGGRAIRDVNDSDRFVVGARGTAYNFDYDIGVLYTQARVRESLTNGYPQYSRLLPLLNSGTVNPFGPSTAAVAQQIAAANYYGQAYESQSSLFGINGKVSREVYNLPAGPISAALGGEVRREQYILNASDAIQTGDLSGYGGNFLNQSDARNVESGFFELNVPVIKGLEINAQGRYDNYEGTGNTFNPKASFRWQPVKEALFRGSWGTGFRAPALTDIFAPVTLGVTGNFDDPLRCVVSPSGIDNTNNSKDCGAQYSQTNGGNRSLQPEKSVSKSLGFAIEPTDQFHFGADYFDTFVRNTIGVITVDQIFSNLGKYSYLVTRGPVQAGLPDLPGPIISVSQQLTNTNNTHVTGVDFDTRLRVPLPVGRLTAALNGTYIIKYDFQNDDGSYTSGLANAINQGGVVARYRHVASLGYDYGPWYGAVIHNFQSAYVDFDTGNPRRVGVYETFDLQASYTGFKGVGITLGMKNVLDKDPPYSNASSAQFQGGYDATYAQPRGRFFYGKLSYMYK